jgi:hypothetical protein
MPWTVEVVQLFILLPVKFLKHILILIKFNLNEIKINLN